MLNYITHKSNTMSKEPLLTPFYRWGYKLLKKLKNLPHIPKLVSVGSEYELGSIDKRLPFPSFLPSFFPPFLFILSFLCYFSSGPQGILFLLILYKAISNAGHGHTGISLSTKPWHGSESIHQNQGFAI